MTQVPDAGWSFATAREPARFGAGGLEGAPGVEHAMADAGTLCGIPEQQITRYRHLFHAEGRQACARCRRQADAAPAQPSPQERLHDRVRAAAQGRARDDVLAALRKGAKIALWINGPSATLAQHYARLDELTEGAGPAADALEAAAASGLACVEDGSWRFIVVLPENGDRPLVARGPRRRG
ncbi:hypothetical protein [Streptomyces hygroscopicus]|uniref:hypothetical protein n=1 Tax=Streptomyces hygroscopicus TaxID=1912 RepID=UPI0022406C56|nr:hypothetical protein [Streptomyces hygroscopicus]